MTSWQPWNWPTDEIPEPRIEHFSYSLEGVPFDWEAHVFPFGEGFSHSWVRLAGKSDFFLLGGILWDGAMPLSEVYAHAFPNFQVARIFYLNEKGQLRMPGEEASLLLSVNANGLGAWSTFFPVPRALTEFTDSAPFRLFEGASVAAFMERPELAIWSELEEAINQPKNDVVFAREWLGITHQQRYDMIWNWRRDERKSKTAELQKLLSCLLLCEDSLWQNGGAWFLSVSSDSDIWLRRDDPFARHEPQYITTTLKLGVQKLFLYFSPFNWKVCGHVCVQALKPDVNHPDRSFDAVINSPTAHERLEAKLRWREWEQSTGD